MSFYPQKCPNKDCQNHFSPKGIFIKKGYFRIKRLNQKIKKFQCKNCFKIFSSRTFKVDYRHKKMDLNKLLVQLLVEGNSLRSASRIIGMTYYNTYKKFLWLKNFIEFEKSKINLKAEKIQFDEMETIHHTKCKPLSIALIVNENYELLAAKVAQIPAKGKLTQFSIKKYGYRQDERVEKLNEIFNSLKTKLEFPPLKIASDAHPSYLNIVKTYFPKAAYQQYNQAEKKRHQDRLHEKLHKKKLDPLFPINHTCALLRSHIKRLTRRSWCTTKKIENLQLHLDLFIVSQYINF